MSSEHFAWMLPAWLWAAGGGLLGLLIGSHLATLVVRWPTGQEASCGRSRCDGCGRTLGPAELLPLLSYIMMQGRCRTCGNAIDRVHPTIEVLAGLVGLLSFLFEPGWGGLAGAVLGWLLIALATLDLRHFWLPDRLTLALAFAGLAFAAVVPPPLADRLIGAGAGYGALASIAWVYRRTRGRDGMGGGDPKLLGALGLWLGWRALPLLLLGASLLGLAGALAARLAGRPVGLDARLPLGTLLAIVAWPLWCWLAFLDGPFALPGAA